LVQAFIFIYILDFEEHLECQFYQHKGKIIGNSGFSKSGLKSLCCLLSSRASSLDSSNFGAVALAVVIAVSLEFSVAII
jgi:hypothetical protein